MRVAVLIAGLLSTAASWGSDERSELKTYAFLSSSYDTNIDRDRTRIRSWGQVIGVGLSFKFPASKPGFEFQYEAASHENTGTNKFDRTSHEFHAIQQQKLSDQWRGTTIAELMIRGSSEDQDINDTYSIGQRLEYRIAKTNRLRAFGVVRSRRPPEDPGGQAINRYAQVQWIREIARGAELSLGYRYEANQARAPVNRYTRNTVMASLDMRIGEKDDLVFDLRYKPRRYTSRFADPGVLRFDNAWAMSAEWAHVLGPGAQVALGLKYETRRSNSRSKDFDQRVAWLTLRYGF